jgi:hypothetical protein
MNSADVSHGLYSKFVAANFQLTESPTNTHGGLIPISLLAAIRNMQLITIFSL